MSILVSISSFLVMRETSALTYAIVALGERILIVIVAIIMLGESLPIFNAAGFAVTLCGIAWYNQMKTHGPPPPPTPLTDAQPPREGSILLKNGSMIKNSSMHPILAEPEEPFSHRRFDNKRKFSLTSSPASTIFVPAPSDADTSEDEQELAEQTDATHGYGAVDEGNQAGSPEAEPLRTDSKNRK
eukprot:GDKK01010898.1.p1 GENE.GDKK01010898.1~~GDKK01010898.1.p1  ORF type:complete len:186 (-),score=34.00 GDKK01010898.1:225-782(-)